MPAKKSTRPAARELLFGDLWEYDPAPESAPAFIEPPAIVNGKIVPPQRPGLGLEVKPDVVEKYRLPE